MATKDRAKRAAQQRKWRAKARKKSRGGRASITVHLSAEDAAAVDALAAAMYLADPHDPGNGQLGISNPSRPEALRMLIAMFRRDHAAELLRGDAGEELRKRRRRLSDFWRAETSWRQIEDVAAGPAQPPAAPWGVEVARRVRRLPVDLQLLKNPQKKPRAQVKGQAEPCAANLSPASKQPLRVEPPETIKKARRKVAGLIGRAKFRGARISAYDAAAAGLDAGGMPYAVSCDTHGVIVGVTTKTIALEDLERPEFCARCMADGG